MGRFLCANENCIPEVDMCNGVDDCGDNSDETTICSGNNKEIYILTYIYIYIRLQFILLDLNFIFAFCLKIKAQFARKIWYHAKMASACIS